MVVRNFFGTAIFFDVMYKVLGIMLGSDSIVRF